MKIESGTGNGYYASVGSNNRLLTSSVSLSRQHFISKAEQKAFQVRGEATPANGTVNVLHIKNDTADQAYTITYIRLSNVDLAAGTALPSAGNYFELGTGLSYSSGGSTVTPVNMYLGSTKIAGGTYYEANPTLTGTFSTFDKHWPDGDGDEQSYSKEGALIIPPGQTMTIRYTGDHTSGTVYSRVSYYVSGIDSLDS